MESMLVKAHKHTPQRIKCSLNDHFAFRTAVPVVFYYRERIPANLIISSLQQVLSDFPIFAGIIIKHNHQLYIDCNNQGVQLRTTYSDSSLFQMLADFKQLDSAVFVDMINAVKSLKHGKPLLTLKLSYFTDGMAIGYCWHHSLGDMSTFMEFLKALSAQAQGKIYQPALIAEDREEYLNKWLTDANHLSMTKQPSGLKYLSFTDIFHFIRQLFLPKRGLFLYFTEEEIETLRNTLSDKAGKKLSRNDVVCAHLLNLLASCRKDKSQTHNATIIVNFRPRIGMLPQVLGNYIGTACLKFLKSHPVDALAKNIHSSVKNFLQESFHYHETQEFVQQIGGVKKLARIVPEMFLPQHKNLIISNWSNFGVYSIDFGLSTPYLFLPLGNVPFPWVSCIVEGFDNKGLLVAVILPSSVAKRLLHPSMLPQIHLYRGQNASEISLPQAVL